MSILQADCDGAGNRSLSLRQKSNGRPGSNGIKLDDQLIALLSNAMVRPKY
jgi:hypothetical protein